MENKRNREADERLENEYKIQLKKIQNEHSNIVKELRESHIKEKVRGKFIFTYIS